MSGRLETRAAPRPRRLGALSLALSISLAVGCAAPPAIRVAEPPSIPKLAARPVGTLVVRPPQDLRPEIEREGSAPKTNFLFSLLFFWWVEKRGNWVTGDEATVSSTLDDLQRLTVGVIQKTGAFSSVKAGPGAATGADFALESEVLHLYGTYYEARRTIVSISKSSGFGGGYHQSNERAAFAAYGNAVIRYRLVDLRGGQRRIVWERVIKGSAQRPPSEEGQEFIGEVALIATTRALAAMAVHLTRAALDGVSAPFDAAAHARALEQQATAGELQFVIARASNRREARELLTIAHPSGEVVAHRIIANVTAPVGRPGEWLLARERTDGTLIPYAEYEVLANLLARHYDLRRVDEMYHYHFFGPRPGTPGAKVSPGGREGPLPSAQPVREGAPADDQVIEIQ